MPQVQCPTCLDSGRNTTFDIAYGFAGNIECHECGTTLEIGNKANKAIINLRSQLWLYLVVATVLPIAATSYVDLYYRIENILPKCGSSAATDIVMNILDENKHNPPTHGFKEDSYELQYIHMTDINSATGARSCAASLFGRKANTDTASGLEYASGITYSIHRSEDGDDGIVVSANW